MTEIPLAPILSPNFQEEVRHNTFYLAAPTIRDDVVWCTMDGEDTLVTRVSAEAESARPLAETLVGAKSLLKPAYLTAVIHMLPNQFWMDADGGWTGPIKYVEEFSQVKLAARVAAPPSQYVPFAQDFPNALGNLEFLVDSVGTEGFVQKGVLDHDSAFSDQSFKIRHVLFTKCGDTKGTNGIEFPIEEWPVSSAKAEEGLRKTKDTHVVNGLPAWDFNGDLIQPSDYRKKLAGAVVYITFTLKHWAYVEHDTTVADVKHMRVLGYLPSSSETRQKPLPMKDPGSPSKKTRQ